MEIVPSSVAETMGLGGILAAASLGGASGRGVLLFLVLARKYMNRTHDGRLLWLVAVLAMAAGGYQMVFSASVVRRMAANSGHVEPPFALDMGANEIVRMTASTSAAGVRRGDRLLEIEGKPYRGRSQLTAAVEGKRPAEAMRLRVRHAGGGEAEMTLRMDAAKALGWEDWTFTLVTAAGTPVFCLALGFFVLFVRPRDPIAWLLLALMLSFSNFTVGNGWDFVRLAWPAGVRDAALAYHTFWALTWPVWMLLFGVLFPDRFPLDRRFPWIKWLIVAPICAHAAVAMAEVVADAEGYRVAPWKGPESLLGTASFYLGLVAVSCFFGTTIARRYMPRAADARRRLRLLLHGATLALTPIFVLAVYRVATGRMPAEIFWAISVPLMGIFPLTLAYVIVVQRALDVRVVIRQGLQYALARRGVRVIQILLTAGAVAPLFTFAQDASRPLPQRAALIGAGIACIVLFRGAAEKLARWVDRRFFREAFNAEKILGELGETVRTMVETAPLLETVANRIRESLHVSRVAMLVRAGNAYLPSYATGYDAAPEVWFDERGSTVGRLRRQREGLRVYWEDPDSWANRDGVLSEEERGQLRRLDAQLLLPLSAKKDLLGFISLGPKRSEEPYSGSDVRLLESVATQTGLALENSRLTAAIAREVARRERINRELEIAREVQERLFPQRYAEIPGLDYAGRCRPALGVGGDYYDFLELPGGRFGIAIGDVSGKGIPAALLMASLQASLRGQTVEGRDDLAGLFGNLNKLIYDATPASRYATLFYGQYDLETRRFCYVNGGHNPPMLFRGGNVLRLEEGGPVIGLLRAAGYTQASVELISGDTLVLFTDGLSEAMNPRGEDWGEERLIETVRMCGAKSPEETIERLIAGADSFVSGAPQHDDLTVMVVKAA